MKRFKKLIASLTSAAMVVGMAMIPSMNSVAAVTLPDLSSSNNAYLICTDNSVVEFTGMGDFSTGVFRFMGENSSLESVSVDSSKKIVTVKNLKTSEIHFDRKDWTLAFLGEENEVSGQIVVEGECYLDSNIQTYESNTLTIKVEENSKFTVTEDGYFNLPSGEGYASVGIALGENTEASKALTIESISVPFEIEPGVFSYNPSTGISGPITFTNKNSSTTTDEDDDTATTDDDEATTEEDDEEEVVVDENVSPDKIEGKDLSWNETKDGKSYWYENGVKQGTKDDPKGVKFDGTVRGREIYDPKTDSWYWLDADADGARAVSKEVFVPYIYQGEGKLSESEMMDLAKLSDGGMNGVGGTVYAAMVNATGKWIRYDAKGQMIKGWYTVSGDDAKLYPKQEGNTYYYDTKTGAMAKGDCVIDGTLYHFDGLTGALKK